MAEKPTREWLEVRFRQYGATGIAQILGVHSGTVYKWLRADEIDLTDRPKGSNGWRTHPGSGVLSPGRQS